MCLDEKSKEDSLWLIEYRITGEVAGIFTDIFDFMYVRRNYYCDHEKTEKLITDNVGDECHTRQVLYGVKDQN